MMRQIHPTQKPQISKLQTKKTKHEHFRLKIKIMAVQILSVLQRPTLNRKIKISWEELTTKNDM